MKKGKTLKKKQIFEIPQNTNSGIYMLYNLNRHKVYIGETQNFRSRAAHHKQRLSTNAHPNKKMQIDFNNGDEFVFVILEDMGESCEKEMLLLKEKMYIFAFRDKYIKVYNNETTEQLRGNLFYYLVTPLIEKIQSDFRMNFGCQMASLERCKSNTLKEKFIIDKIEQ